MADAEVAYGDNYRDTAVLLLAAADELGLPRSVIKTTTRGVFLVPEEVKAKASGTAEKKPAKKAAAKKTAAKKTAAKKATAKKTKE